MKTYKSQRKFTLFPPTERTKSGVRPTQEARMIVQPHCSGHIFYTQPLFIGFLLLLKFQDKSSSLLVSTVHKLPCILNKFELFVSSCLQWRSSDITLGSLSAGLPCLQY